MNTRWWCWMEMSYYLVGRARFSASLVIVRASFSMALREITCQWQLRTGDDNDHTAGVHLIPSSTSRCRPLRSSDTRP